VSFDEKKNETGEWKLARDVQRFFDIFASLIVSNWARYHQILCCRNRLLKASES